MALSAGAGGSGSGRRRRGRGRTRRQTLSEINVTPLVDVMLVLLIIFMISAPLLTVGVDVNLPKTEASAVKDNQKPVTVTVHSDGSIVVQEQHTDYDNLVDALQVASGGDHDLPIYLKADKSASYGVVAVVMAKLSTSGFTKIEMITAPGTPETPAR
jgi:biopolymer transport protein TolR